VAQSLYHLWLDEDGQDVIEYSMLLAFIVLLCLAFAFAGSASIHGIWTQSNSDLAAANTVNAS
jgi:Flp pilus assembly pilin Flp